MADRKQILHDYLLQTMTHSVNLPFPIRIKKLDFPIIICKNPLVVNFSNVCVRERETYCLCWGLNMGPLTCKSSTLPIELKGKPTSQS